MALAEAEAHQIAEENKLRTYRAKQDAYRSTLDVQVREVKMIKPTISILYYVLNPLSLYYIMY
jgi:hypothetical protein